MTLNPMRTLRGRYVALPMENIDTDQIIPARFLKVTDKKGLGQSLFADWRFDDEGRERTDMVLNDPVHAGAKIIVAGDNFGCGSSREHASWALTGYGIRAVLSTSLGDIFSNNALKSGLLPLVVDSPTLRTLFENFESNGKNVQGNELEIDIEAQTIELKGKFRVQFSIDAFARYRLLNGIDELEFLLKHEKEIAAFESRYEKEAKA